MNHEGQLTRVSDFSDLLTKYEHIIKLWPANTIDIWVKRISGGDPIENVIKSRPQSGTELFEELSAVHGLGGAAGYEIKFFDALNKQFRGMGRIFMPGTRSSERMYDGMRVDIRDHAPVRAQVHAGLKALLVQGRQIWGPDRLPLDEIVVRLMVGVGDIARAERDEGHAHRETGRPMSPDLKKELGNIIFSTIRWIDDLGLDPLECLDLAIEAQEKFARSGRVR